jgi:hypothetical protein
VADHNVTRMKLGASAALSGSAELSEFSFFCSLSAQYELYITRDCNALISIKLMGRDGFFPLPLRPLGDKVNLWLYKGCVYHIVVDISEFVAPAEILLCLKPPLGSERLLSYQLRTKEIV